MMSENSGSSPEGIEDGFRKVLDRHGYSFHYSILKLAQDLSENRESPWLFVAAEFPVEVRGHSTRIDFLLRYREGTKFYLVAECKRANPALSNWCFVKAPYVRRGSGRDALIAEHIQALSDTAVISDGEKIGYSKNIFDIGVEVKSDIKGDASGQGRGAIEEAASQVLRGVNGLVEFFRRHPQIRAQSKLIVPVIFTTASIWTSDVNISEADLETGNLDPATLQAMEQPWIWYRYHQSPGLTHDLTRGEPYSDITAALDSEFARTVAIVNARGAAQFLRSEWWS